jgi:hypothetical protein
MEGEATRWYESLPPISLSQLDMPCSLAIVESVRDGATLRVRLFMPDGEHQFVNIALVGARSPRVASKQGETSEPWGDEVSDCGGLAYMPREYLNHAGEIFHRIASASTRRKSSTSLATHRDRHAIPD